LLDWLQAWDLAIGVEPRRDQHPWLEPWRYLALPPDTPTELFVGRFDGEAVASSLAFVGGGAVGLYGVGTVPGYRGRGFGGALAAAAVEWGRGRGERYAILHSTEIGEPVYRRLGFRPVGELTQLVLRPPKPS
jgi:GNAT superfamily N-acetyltransferase